MRTLVSTLLICILLACGGGGTGSDKVQPAPVISNLVLSPTSASVGPSGSTATAILTFDFTDPEGDITAVRLTLGANSQDAPIPELAGVTSGSLQGTLRFDTSVEGPIRFQVALVDAQGHVSNQLTVVFTVTPPPPPQPVISSLSPVMIVAGGPGFTLAVEGSNFSPNSKVLWNGAPRPTVFVSGQLLKATIPPTDIASAGSIPIIVSNPAAEGGNSIASKTLVSNMSVQSLGGPVNDVAWAAPHGLLYASVSAGASQYGASLVAVDPGSGSVVKAVVVQGEPDRIAISGDGSYLYAGINGSGQIQRFLLPDLVPDLTIPLGLNSFFQPYAAMDIQVAPGQPRTIAVLVKVPSQGPEVGEGIVIFDDATRRSLTTIGQPSGHSVSTIQWGPDPSVIYGSDDNSTGFGYYILDVNATGIRLRKTVDRVFTDFGARIKFEPSTSRVYACTGQVVQAGTGLVLATFPLKGTIVPSLARQSVFFLTAETFPNHVLMLREYSMATYSELHYAQIPWDLPVQVYRLPIRLIRWGTNGLASCGSGNPLYIYTNPFPATAPPAFSSDPDHQPQLIATRNHAAKVAEVHPSPRQDAPAGRIIPGWASSLRPIGPAARTLVR